MSDSATAWLEKEKDLNHEYEIRQKAIAQNGNSGLHYEDEFINSFKRGLPSVTAKERKETPVFSGVLKYFPDAIADVAKCSFKGQEQHNPGKPLAWDRSKSGDELDALSRHLIDAGTFDTDGIRHSAKVAWRALANLQKEIERNGK